MSWCDHAIKMLRIIVGDNSSETPTYSDSRLEETLVVGAQLMTQEVDFSTSYTINLISQSISPDPVANNDDAFLNLMVLKAACLIDQGTFRTKALSAGILAKCGPAVLDTTKHLPGFKTLLDVGPCAAYQEMKDQWIFGNSQIVEAILSPFVSSNFDPSQSFSGTNRYNNDY